MIRFDDLVVLNPQITPTVAQLLVVATWKADDALGPPLPALAGEVIGPLCEYAETLRERVPLRSGTNPRHLEQSLATARILEPCFWAPQHPFCYELNLELRHGERVVDRRRLLCGIRHLSATRSEMLLNGTPSFIRGVRHGPEAMIEELEAWHDVECSALLVRASDPLCSRADRWGPMLLHLLPRDREATDAEIIRLRNHPSVLLWGVPAGLDDSEHREFVNTIRRRDPSRLIWQLVGIDEPVSAENPVDLLALPFGHWAIGSARLEKPYLVLGDTSADPDRTQFDNFSFQIDELCESLGSPPGLVGVIL